MIHHQLSIPQWLGLPADVRVKLKSIFNIPRSSGSQIVDKEVVSDGHTHKDLAELTVEKMQAYLSSEETDFWKLMDVVLDKIQKERGEEIKNALKQQEELQDELAGEKAEALAELARKMEEIASGAEEVIVKRRGRPRKEV